ncbi:intradiol ring-cleavage dioxygenase [uncultured Psychroserpens sp.]|uniref:dioxygenase family protein n=1 Tax=uncultured Psychroserpens sp. TaxID=255436 RepID=UPI0026318590|nr:intradiol ring-cleavage dioxygenase [uncultured Psychroserpens sp.]
MKHLVTLLISLILIASSCAQSQSTQVGGSCEGCEAVNDYGKKTLQSIDTIHGFKTETDKIKINGTVYHKDGKTPAKDVVLYVYHTDQNGRYPTNTSSKGWEKRHGYLRTWLKTDEKGCYTFYTTRPASYPNSTVPQHIHITVKEPNVSAYYVEDFYFSDDPNITPNIVKRAKPRGGSGVITLKGNAKIKTATRDIILGLNIPNY